MKRIITLVAVLALMLATLSVPFSVSADEYLFCATRAIRISDTEIVIEFTKPVSADGLNHPFTAMRWMNMDGSGVRPTGVAWDGSIPLQNSKTEWKFWSETDHTRIVLTFENKAVLDGYEETTGSANYDAGRRAYLVMEEQNPATGHGHDTLYDVTATDGSALRATSLAASDEWWDFVALKVEKNYSYTPSDSVPNTELAGIIVHKPSANITTLSGKPTSEISFVFRNSYAGDWAWGIALIPRNAETGKLEMPKYVDFLSDFGTDRWIWYNFDNDENVKIDGVEQNTTWSYPTSPTDKNGDRLFKVLFQIPEAVLNAAGYESLEEAAEDGALVGYICEYTLDHLNTGYMDQNPQAGRFRANAYRRDGREAVVMKVLPEDAYYNPAPVTSDTSDESDEPIESDDPAESDDPVESDDPAESDDPVESGNPADTTAAPSETSGTTDGSEVPDAPSTSDASMALTSVAVVALIGCAALIVYKEKH